MTIEEVPQFELTFDLPLFYRQMFELLLNNHKNLRIKAEECLRVFLFVFKEVVGQCKPLSSKIKSDSAQMLVAMTLVMVRENLAPDITFHSLEWL